MVQTYTRAHHMEEGAACTAAAMRLLLQALQSRVTHPHHAQQRRNQKSSSRPAARMASCSTRRRRALRRGCDGATPASARPRLVPCLIRSSNSPALHQHPSHRRHFLAAGATRRLACLHVAVLCVLREHGSTGTIASQTAVAHADLRTDEAQLQSPRASAQRQQRAGNNAQNVCWHRRRHGALHAQHVRSRLCEGCKV